MSLFPIGLVSAVDLGEVKCAGVILIKLNEDVRSVKPVPLLHARLLVCGYRAVAGGVAGDMDTGCGEAIRCFRGIEQSDERRSVRSLVAATHLKGGLRIPVDWYQVDIIRYDILHYDYFGAVYIKPHIRVSRGVVQSMELGKFFICHRESHKVAPIVRVTTNQNPITQW